MCPVYIYNIILGNELRNGRIFHNKSREARMYNDSRKSHGTMQSKIIAPIIFSFCYLIFLCL